MDDGANDFQARIGNAIKRQLRPELLNRISQTVVFNPLRNEDVRLIIEKFLARLNKRLAEQTMSLTLEESAYALLMEKGFSPEFGARPMERAIEQLITQPLAKAILENQSKASGKMLARVVGGRMELNSV